MPTRRTRALVPLALAACLALGACGSSDDDNGSTSAGSTATTTAAAVDNTLSLATTETADGAVELTVDGPQRSGLTSIELRNDGRRPHDAQLVRVEGEHTQDEVMRAFDTTGRGGPLPDWFFAGGGVGEIPPGTTQTVVQRLEPGTYWVFDTSTEDGEGEGRPNYRAGGVARIDVSGEESGGTAATADATVTAEDFRFTTEGPLRTGGVTVDFVNAGREIHHLLAFPLLPGRTIADVRRALASERAQPPIDFRNGVNTAAIEGGTEQQVTLDFRRGGRYALICFISNRAGGPPHALMGMVGEVEVQ